MYLALASVTAPEQVREGARVGLYSYGSGCCAGYRGLVDERSVETVAAMEIAASLAARVELDFATYVELSGLNRECLVPHQDRDVDLDRCRPVLAAYGRPREVLTFTGVKDSHRTLPQNGPRPASRTTGRLRDPRPAGPEAARRRTEGERVNDTEIFEVVRRRTVEVLPTSHRLRSSIDGRLVDLGANSLDRVDIVTLTMDELGVVVPVTEFGGVSDLRSLVTLLGKYVS